jgi:hypothetical protein
MQANTISRFPLGARNTQELEVRLRVRQQQLRNYQHYPRGLSTIAAPPILNETSHVTCLQLFSGNMQDFQLARLLFERMTAVTHLTITVRYHPDWKITTHGLRFGDVTTIFAAGSAFRHTTKVRHLRLEGVVFYGVGTSLPEVFPFDDLSHLHLHRCVSTGVLCESLGRLKLNLQSFCNDSPCNRSPPDAVDAFLKSIPPLRQLRIAQSKFANGAQVESFDWTSSRLMRRNYDASSWTTSNDGVKYLSTRRETSQTFWLSVKAPPTCSNYQSLDPRSRGRLVIPLWAFYSDSKVYIQWSWNKITLLT